MNEAPRRRARDLGIQVGVLPTGAWNAITDVHGVRVGHQTIRDGDRVHTGVTVIVPHDGNVFQQKLPAAVCVGNGYGKMTGIAQVRELGNIESPIALTNTLNVFAALEGLVRYTLAQPGNESVTSVNAIAGETHDGRISDIRGLHVKADHVLAALASAKSGAVEEGCVGAGTGTWCLGFKGGIGTASRKVASDDGAYTVGVLVQSNYDGILTINGAPVGREFTTATKAAATPASGDGSCMIVVATDAPLDARNLERLAKRALMGLARTGSVMDNGSGDFVIAFSTAYRIAANAGLLNPPVALVSNNHMNAVFLAAAEATEEALYNSLFMAKTTVGFDGVRREAIPLDRVVEICARYNVLNLQQRHPVY